MYQIISNAVYAEVTSLSKANLKGKKVLMLKRISLKNNF